MSLRVPPAVLALAVAACAFLPVVPAGAALTASGSSRNVTVTLVPEATALEPGKPLWVGLHLKMAPHWHTYWKNPGDSGLPTRIQWRLPDGVTAGDLQWPRPERIPAGPLMSYGYEHEVLLLTEIRPSAAAPSGDMRIGARVEWLECREACLPGKAELEITVPVAKGAPWPGSEWEPVFRKFRERLPRASSGLQAEAVTTGAGLTLTISGLAAPRQAYFFPARTQVVDHAAPQKLTPVGAAFRVQMTPAANTTLPERIDGVLEADGHAYEIHAPVVSASSAAVTSPEPPASAVSRMLPALAFAFAGGLILNLMPCVLPVLSLKVMAFVRHGGESRMAALRHGLAFTMGVLAFFWLLAGGLLALRAAGQQVGWGFQLQSPPFVVFLAALFLLVALNLFGVFAVGQSLTAAGNLEAKWSGLASSFWSGALATIVATPCTAPFMGSALGFALGQPPAATMLIFGALGLGMAAPYLALSASPRLLRRLPKPGRWMESLQQALGFPMLGTVVFLVWLFGRQSGVNAMSWLLAALLLIAAGAWLYGRGTAPTATRGGRLTLVTSAGALVAAGLTLGLSQAQASPASPGVQADGWEPYSESRLADLRRAGQPVFIDFTADWCLTCQVNHRVALEADDVRERFVRQGVIRMKADWTLRDERISRALAAHGRQGVPLYVLYGRGRDAPARLLPEVLSPGVVLQALDETL
jgi:thiol:disulfide interchange protein DsbD